MLGAAVAYLLCASFTPFFFLKTALPRRDAGGVLILKAAAALDSREEIFSKDVDEGRVRLGV